MELCLGPHRAATVVMTLLSFTAAASPLYRGSAQLPAPPPPPPHTRKWRPIFSLPLQPLPNYHGTEAV